LGLAALTNTIHRYTMHSTCTLLHSICTTAHDLDIDTDTGTAHIDTHTQIHRYKLDGLRPKGHGSAAYCMYCMFPRYFLCYYRTPAGWRMLAQVQASPTTSKKEEQ
jgi:hypothetical protein